MTESRAERLARIRAVVEADPGEIEVSISDISGAWCRDGEFRACTLEDLAWLLAQVPTDVLAPGGYPRIGDRATVSGVVVAADLSNGRDFDDPQWALLPDGEYRVTIRVGTEDAS